MPFESVRQLVRQEYRLHKPPATTKPPNTKSLNQSISLVHRLPVACPLPVLALLVHQLLHHLEGFLSLSTLIGITNR